MLGLSAKKKYVGPGTGCYVSGSCCFGVPIKAARLFPILKSDLNTSQTLIGQEDRHSVVASSTVSRRAETAARAPARHLQTARWSFRGPVRISSFVVLLLWGQRGRRGPGRRREPPPKQRESWTGTGEPPSGAVASWKTIRMTVFNESFKNGLLCFHICAIKLLSLETHFSMIFCFEDRSTERTKYRRFRHYVTNQYVLRFFADIFWSLKAI